MVGMAIIRVVTVTVTSSDVATVSRAVGATTDGYHGENLATQLHVHVPATWDTYNAYVTWEAADGWQDESPAFLIADPAALSFDYELPFNAMKAGPLKVSITAKKTIGPDTQVAHTANFALNISRSVDGTSSQVTTFNDAINDLQDRVSAIEGGSAITNGVAATGVLADNKIVRGDGGVRNVQSSTIVVDDSGNMSAVGTIGSGAITSTGLVQGATGKFGDVAGGNYSEFEADGTYKANGTATYFDDVIINLSVAKSPASGYPTWTSYKGSEVPAFSKTAVNTLYWAVQFPHKLKEGSNLEFHLHVAYPDAGTGKSAWRMTHSWADIDEAFPDATTPTDVVVDAPGLGGTDKHKVIEIVASITGTGKHISSVLLGSISRLGNDGTNDTYDNVIYALSADFHVECDTLGSRTPIAK